METDDQCCIEDTPEATEAAVEGEARLSRKKKRKTEDNPRTAVEVSGLPEAPSAVKCKAKKGKLKRFGAITTSCNLQQSASVENPEASHIEGAGLQGTKGRKKKRIAKPDASVVKCQREQKEHGREVEETTTDVGGAEQIDVACGGVGKVKKKKLAQEVDSKLDVVEDQAGRPRKKKRKADDVCDVNGKGCKESATPPPAESSAQNADPDAELLPAIAEGSASDKKTKQKKKRKAAKEAHAGTAKAMLSPAELKELMQSKAANKTIGATSWELVPLPEGSAKTELTAKATPQTTKQGAAGTEGNEISQGAKADEELEAKRPQAKTDQENGVEAATTEKHRDSSSPEAAKGEKSSACQMQLVNADEGEKEKAPDAIPSGTCGSSQDEAAKSCLKVCVTNLCTTLGKTAIWERFEHCGSIKDVHLLKDWYTQASRGICFVTFETRDGVQEALKLNGQDVAGQAVIVNLALDKPAAGKGKAKNKGKGHDSGRGKGSGKTAQPALANYEWNAGKSYSKGKSKGAGKTSDSCKTNATNQDAAESAPTDVPEGCTGLVVKRLSFAATESDLRETFAGCGAGPTRARILMDKEGWSKGKGFVDFADRAALEAAVKLHGTKMKGRPLVLEYARAKEGA